MMHNMGLFIPILANHSLTPYDAFGSFVTYSSFGQKLNQLIPHFPGNFWIAKTDYLRRLDFSLLTSSDRFSSEYLLGTKLGNFFNIEAYPHNIYTYRSNYKIRKLIKYISKSMSSYEYFELPPEYNNFYLGSELSSSQRGFPQFISSPTWFKYVQ